MSSNVPFWDYGSSSLATENYIRLVPAIQSRVGWLWNNQPNNMDNWEVIFDFKIHNTQSPGADGLAFWLVKDPKIEGSLYGYKDDFEGIGVIFDTYDNNHNGDNPAVVLIQNDGRKVEWDIGNDLLANQIERCLSHFRNPINDKATAKVRYNQGNLQISMDTFGKGEFRECIIAGVVIPKGLYFGFTAATGGLTDFHDVLNFHCNELNPQMVVKDKQEDEGMEEGRKGWYDPYRNVERTENEGEQESKIKEDEIRQESSSKIQKKLQEQLSKEKKMRDRKKRDDTDKEKEKEKEDVVEREYFDNLRRRLEGLGHGHIPGDVESNLERLPDEEVTFASSDDEDFEVYEDLSHETGIIIVEALEEVVTQIRHSSTKGDISAILRRVEAVSEIQQEIGDLMLNRNQEIQEELQELSTKLGTQTDLLNDELRKLDGILNSLSMSVSDMQRKQGYLQKEFDSAKTDLSQTITQTGSWGFGMWFILFQVIFIVSFFFYKKYSDERKRKLI